MASVEMTRHLFRFFPQLQDQKITVPAGSVANVIQAVESMAPGFSHYVLDERGALRLYGDHKFGGRVKLTHSVSLKDQIEVPQLPL